MAGYRISRGVIYVSIVKVGLNMKPKKGYITELATLQVYRARDAEGLARSGEDASLCRG